MNTSVITLHHPDGSLKLSVPTDIPIDELMPDFLDVARQPDGDGWLLGPRTDTRTRPIEHSPTSVWARAPCWCCTSRNRGTEQSRATRDRPPA